MKLKTPLLPERLRCRKKFLYYFPKGFIDPTYIAWERKYKLDAHVRFQEELNRDQYENLLAEKKYEEIALKAVKIETKTNLLFSFEKMALRDAVKSADGSKAFAEGLFKYVYGKQDLQQRFEEFSDVLISLPRRQTRVATWPLHTVFGFIGNPEQHVFLKPRVTQIAAAKYKYYFIYQSRPNWETYQSLLDFINQIRKDISDLKPRDFIDLQSFIWVMGSEEYPD